MAEPALETAPLSPGLKGKYRFPPPLPACGGLGKEVNEIAEITIFAHLFLPPSRLPPSPPNLVPQIVLFQRLLLKVSCRCIHSKGLSKSANSFPRRVVRPAGSYLFNVQSSPYSALLYHVVANMPVVESGFVPSWSRAGGPEARPPGCGVPRRAAGLAERGCLPPQPPRTDSWMLRAMPVPPARSSRCWARCAVKPRSGGGCGAARGPLGHLPSAPGTREDEPRYHQRIGLAGLFPSCRGGTRSPFSARGGACPRSGAGAARAGPVLRGALGAAHK